MSILNIIHTVSWLINDLNQIADLCDLNKIIKNKDRLNHSERVIPRNQEENREINVQHIIRFNKEIMSV